MTVANLSERGTTLANRLIVSVSIGIVILITISNNILIPKRYSTRHIRRLQQTVGPHIFDNARTDDIWGGSYSGTGDEDDMLPNDSVSEMKSIEEGNGYLILPDQELDGTTGEEMYNNSPMMRDENEMMINRVSLPNQQTQTEINNVMEKPPEDPITQETIDGSVADFGQEVNNLSDRRAPPPPQENIAEGEDDERIGNSAIVVLLNNDQTSINQLCHGVATLYEQGISKPNSPILVFVEYDFPGEKKTFLMECTQHPVIFHEIRLFEFPEGFDPVKEIKMGNRVVNQARAKTPGRKKWGFSHVIRFWTSQVWKHPAIDQFETIMRFDADSCFLGNPDENHDEDWRLPGMRGRFVYRTDGIGVGSGPWINGLYEFAVSYMKEQGLKPRNPELWDAITSAWENKKELPLFHKNFEISRVSFFKRNNVMAWHDAVTDSEPFGVYKYRWSDANTRVFTMAIFADPRWILFKKHDGYRHGKPCESRVKKFIRERRIAGFKKDEGMERKDEAAGDESANSLGSGFYNASPMYREPELINNAQEQFYETIEEVSEGPNSEARNKQFYDMGEDTASEVVNLINSNGQEQQFYGTEGGDIASGEASSIGLIGNSVDTANLHEDEYYTDTQNQQYYDTTEGIPSQETEQFSDTREVFTGRGEYTTVWEKGSDDLQNQRFYGGTGGTFNGEENSNIDEQSQQIYDSSSGQHFYNTGRTASGEVNPNIYGQNQNGYSTGSNTNIEEIYQQTYENSGAFVDGDTNSDTNIQNQQYGQNQNGYSTGSDTNIEEIYQQTYENSGAFVGGDTNPDTNIQNQQYGKSQNGYSTGSDTNIEEIYQQTYENSGAFVGGDTNPDTNIQNQQSHGSNTHQQQPYSAGGVGMPGQEPEPFGSSHVQPFYDTRGDTTSQMELVNNVDAQEARTYNQNPAPFSNIPLTSSLNAAAEVEQLDRQQTTIEFEPLTPEEVRSEHAIVALVTGDKQSLEDFCVALKTLRDNYILKFRNAILVFHEDDLTDDKKKVIEACIDYPISFHPVDFTFPAGFDPDEEYKRHGQVANIRTKAFNRKKWGYTRMIRFWTTQVWKHPVVRKYKTVMRIDTDSCFVEAGDTKDIEDMHLPGMRGRYVYRTDGIATGANSYIDGLYDFAISYMKEKNIEPKNKILWERIQETWRDEEQTLPIFTKNFEVSRLMFFTRNDVMNWHDALTEREPFGVFRQRWSDAYTRVFTMAMFAESDSLLIKKHPGYIHGRDKCMAALEDVANQKITPPMQAFPSEIGDMQAGVPIESQSAQERMPVELNNGQAYTLPSEGYVEVTPKQQYDTDIQELPPVREEVNDENSHHAIITLLKADEPTLTQFCYVLESLARNAIIKTNTPIILFHEGDLKNKSKDYVEKCSNNPIFFRLVEFGFPSGFDAELELEQNPRVANQGRMNNARKTWSYAHIITFWTTDVWKHPTVQQFDTVMRIDSDSCFTQPQKSDDIDDLILPGIADKYVYRVNGIGTGVSTWIKDLYEFTMSYVKKEGITPQNPNLWNLAQNTWEKERTLPIFHKSLEVNRVSFFMRDDVAKWHNALTEHIPYGVYRYRWSDSNTRVLTMALFASEGTVLVRNYNGYKHGTGCMDYFNRHGIST